MSVSVNVHYRDPRTRPAAAPCGYAYNKRLHGYDFVSTWDLDAPVPVDCLECLMHKPPKRKVLPWQADARKR